MFQSVTVMILSLVQIFPSLVNESPFILNPVSFWQNHLSSKVSLFSGLAKCLKTIIPYISCPGTLSKSLSHIQLFAIPWTVARLLSMEFSRQECWSGLPFPSPGDLPKPGIQPGSPTLQADSLPSEPPGKLQYICLTRQNKLKSQAYYRLFFHLIFTDMLTDWW